MTLHHASPRMPKEGFGSLDLCLRSHNGLIDGVTIRSIGGQCCIMFSLRVSEKLEEPNKGSIIPYVKRPFFGPPTLTMPGSSRIGTLLAPELTRVKSMYRIRELCGAGLEACLRASQ